MFSRRSVPRPAFIPWPWDLDDAWQRFDAYYRHRGYQWQPATDGTMAGWVLQRRKIPQ